MNRSGLFNNPTPLHRNSHTERPGAYYVEGRANGPVPAWLDMVQQCRTRPPPPPVPCDVEVQGESCEAGEPCNSNICTNEEGEHQPEANSPQLDTSTTRTDPPRLGKLNRFFRRVASERIARRIPRVSRSHCAASNDTDPSSSQTFMTADEENTSPADFRPMEIIQNAEPSLGAPRTPTDSFSGCIPDPPSLVRYSSEANICHMKHRLVVAQVLEICPQATVARVLELLCHHDVDTVVIILLSESTDIRITPH